MSSAENIQYCYWRFNCLKSNKKIFTRFNSSVELVFKVFKATFLFAWLVLVKMSFLSLSASLGRGYSKNLVNSPDTQIGVNFVQAFLYATSYFVSILQ